MEVVISDIKEERIEQELRKMLNASKSKLNFPDGMILESIEYVKIENTIRDISNDFSGLGRFKSDGVFSTSKHFSGKFDVKKDKICLDERFFRFKD